jgi:hypothetical protein
LKPVVQGESTGKFFCHGQQYRLVDLLSGIQVEITPERVFEKGLITTNQFPNKDFLQFRVFENKIERVLIFFNKEFKRGGP